jgi:hypothetical protein
MRRRAFLADLATTASAAAATAVTAGTAATTSVALAGCLGSADEAYEPPAPLADPPAGVYRPRAIPRMRLVGVADAGPFRLALAYGYPVRFFEVVGEQTYLRDVEPADDVHLVALAFDPETGVVFPEVGLTVEVARGDELVAHEAVYAMVSQGMGFHYGDNFALDGDAGYDVTVSVGGLQVDRTGAFAGRFDEPASHTFAFEYARADRDALAVVAADDPGTRGAFPVAALDEVPAATAPGTRHGGDDVGPAVGEPLGRARASDVVFDVRVRREADDAPQLVVLAYTPYNDLLLPNMGLEATVERDGNADEPRILQRTVDPALGYHYATAVEELDDATGVTIETLTPPQVARHEGYETAFLDVDDVHVALD